MEVLVAAFGEVAVVITDAWHDMQVHDLGVVDGGARWPDADRFQVIAWPALRLLPKQALGGDGQLALFAPGDDIDQAHAEAGVDGAEDHADPDRDEDAHDEHGED